MRVDWAIACRYVEVNGGLATIIGAGIDTFWVSEFPANLTVPVAVKVAGSQDEVENEHVLMGRVLNPQLEEIASIQGTFTAESSLDAQPGWEASIALATLHVFTATEPGAYTIDVNVDGRSQTVPLAVRQLPAAP